MMRERTSWVSSDGISCRFLFHLFKRVFAMHEYELIESPEARREDCNTHMKHSAAGGGVPPHTNKAQCSKQANLHKAGESYRQLHHHATRKDHKRRELKQNCRNATHTSILTHLLKCDMHNNYYKSADTLINRRQDGEKNHNQIPGGK